MAKEFTSIQSLLQQVHGTAAPAAEEVSPEVKAKEEEAKLLAAVAKFKDEVLADAEIRRRVAKFRREGIYAVTPAQWAGIVIGIPLLIGLIAYGVHFASEVTRANLAIRKALDLVYVENFPAAEESLNRALALGAAESPTLLRFARALADVEEFDLAIRFFDRAGETARAAGEYRVMVEAAVGAAEIFLSRGSYEEAENRVNPILTLDPKERAPLIILGRILFAQSRFAEAEQAFINSLERNPSSLSPRYYLRETYLKLGRIEDAREQEELMLYARPSGDEDVTTMIGYADLLIREGRIDDAEQTLLKIVETNSKPLPQIMVTLGHLAIEKQDIQKAQTYADSAVAAAPDDPEGYVLRAELHYHYQRGTDAIRDLNKALSLDPLNAKALYNMGNILFYDLNMPDQALSHFQRAVGEGFDGPFIWYNIGTANMLLRRPTAAIAAYKKMPQSLSISSDVEWAKATAYLLGGQIDTALKIFAELAQSRENDPALENNIGVILELAGDTLGAQKRYWAAVRASKGEERDTVALGNINRLIAGRPPTNLWQATHHEIALRPRGIVLPRRR